MFINYAVISISGHQYKVTRGDIITTDRLAQTEGSIISLPVLLYREGEKLSIGNPYLDNVKVSAKLLNSKLGGKIHVVKFKAKSRYRKKIGFRPQHSVLEIHSLGFNSTREKAVSAPLKNSPKKGTNASTDRKRPS